jgi:Arc/MetJ-type ribon-helix-helix transcriptional regulator
VWLKPSVKAVIDQAIQNGRFKSRTEAIEWALASAFEEKSA